MDGFDSLKGGLEWGSVLTKPIEVTGASLHYTPFGLGKEINDDTNTTKVAAFSREAVVILQAALNSERSTVNGQLLCLSTKATTSRGVLTGDPGARYRRSGYGCGF